MVKYVLFQWAQYMFLLLWLLLSLSTEGKSRIIIAVIWTSRFTETPASQWQSRSFKAQADEARTTLWSLLRYTVKGKKSQTHTCCLRKCVSIRQAHCLWVEPSVLFRRLSCMYFIQADRKPENPILNSVINRFNWWLQTIHIAQTERTEDMQVTPGTKK